ncbi:glycine cleavage system aminomethyltransferase GcvT [Leptolyngbya sp. FACHB-711]|uniref:glycine cleavage system aminomethyltransferase GcvT n=1 Tax=unclassified Leptolyngbya TaxID=2650499 RepID=UPI001688FFD5|nr:glycine cleavage system aminomethyltransferase GcvT [Leptolyngbya sp. FACHB-711]MBD1852125.1 glycine cleavage system aminomethyltransferase GcvT [Cyanobacteria bacterium FACHB-502]MBD2023852.1 glycine cleavage system aminomethyltransferase GcvT [Leptolyngbya sp. FACHB-711]
MADPTSDIALLKTLLHLRHLELKARMVPFSGWEMPVQYEGISKEHQAVRQAAGMFDISHMGKFVLQGKRLIEQLQLLVPSDLSRLQAGEAQYTVLLNDRGGIIDDLIIYYQGETPDGVQRVTTIVNAATTGKDRNWLKRHLDLNQIEFIDLSADQVLVAVQGPQAIEKLQAFVQENLFQVKRFGHLEGTVLGQPGFLARTGYTGEDGYEVMVEPGVGEALWEELRSVGVVPCGLGARDTLRLEAAMALYGMDIDETTTPLEAGLGWLVHLDRKGDFIGRSVLEQQKQNGLQRRLVGLRTEGRNIARHGYPVLSEGKPIGEITSGTLSPTLGYPIALAYVAAELAQLDRVLQVEIRGKSYPATVVKRPFYKSS